MSKPILYAAGTLVLVLLGALGWYMNALGDAREENGRLESELSECVAANETGQTAIDELEAKVDELRSRRIAEQARADAMALELQKEQAAYAERVQALEEGMAKDRETNDEYQNWADRPLPDTVRNRLQRAGGGHRNPDG